MSKTSARLTHITANGLGNDPETRPTPDFLAAARIRRATLENSVRWFLEDGDTVAAQAAMVALNELNATIAKLERLAMPPAGTCPVCGRNLTEIVPFDTVCPQCAARWFEQIHEIEF